MNRRVWSVAVGALTTLCCMQPLWGSESLERRISRASDYVESGAYFRAADELALALDAVGHEKVQQLLRMFPHMPHPWEREDAPGRLRMDAVVEGTHASAWYTNRQGARIKMIVAVRSPLLRSTIRMLQNPLFIEASGLEIDQIHSFPAIIDYDSAQQAGIIHVVVDEVMLVSAEGWDLPRQTLVDTIEKFDFSALSRMLHPFAAED